jgi:uncharacterized protein (TIGR03492 family)
LSSQLSSKPLSYSAQERLLCLSNGHGEDVVAIRILKALQDQSPHLKLAALPLVGEGHAYLNLGIPIIGPVKSMPSGGFIYMDGWQLVRDLRGGLLQLTLRQFWAIRQWAKQGGSILAVGDIVPLILACLSGAPYAFVGTAKSEYLLRDQAGALLPHAFSEGWSGSVYYPWERWMMNRRLCRAVFPRDQLTTQFLQKWRVPAFSLGNPMMDELEPQMLAETELVRIGSQRGLDIPVLTVPSMETPSERVPRVLKSRSLSEPGTLRVVLLPGSRPPEAYENWQHILQAVHGLIAAFPAQNLVFLGAIAPNLTTDPLRYALETLGWQSSFSGKPNLNGLTPADTGVQWFSYPRSAQPATLAISQNSYVDYLHQGDCAIAMAGTGTEQFVGLGKPAIIMPGHGPQFTAAFAQTQTYLLGESVLLVKDPSQVATILQKLFNNPEQLQRIAKNGRDRMGQPGAAHRIATFLLAQLQSI